MDYPSGRLQYQSSFYKPKTYKDMEEKTLFKLARGNANLSIPVTQKSQVASTQDVYAEIKKGNSERWTIQSQKRKYVNGKLFVIEVGYSASINTPDYVLEEDKSNNLIQITARGTSGLCILTQNESGNKINLHLTTPEETTPEEKEYWEIHFNPIAHGVVNTGKFFTVTTNISDEGGSMAQGTSYKNWIVNQNRHTINVHISSTYPGNFEMLSWSCLDKNGNAFNPNYNLPSNSYFTTKETGLGSYTLTKVSTPLVSSAPILSSRFNPTKEYPLDLNFYWVAATFTLSGLPTSKGYFLFGKGARPQKTSPSDQVYIQGLSATGTTTLNIPFSANDSEPGTRIECTTGDKVAVYTKSGGTWILEGSFIVPDAGETVSI